MRISGKGTRSTSRRRSAADRGLAVADPGTGPKQHADGWERLTRPPAGRAVTLVGRPPARRRGRKPLQRLALRTRPLAISAVLGAAVLALAAAAPARAVPSAGSQAGPSVVQSAEWWFSSWEIRSDVWPLSRGAGVTVGIVDSGVQSLPDFRGALLPGGNTIGIDSNGQSDGEAPTGHGTGVAALIAGQGVDGGVLGIAPAAKILPVLVLVGEGVGSNGEVTFGSGTQQDMAAGIRMAVKDGVQVINLSLAAKVPSASYCAPVLQDAVAYALQHNVVVVAAAGNFNTTGNPPVEPASCAGVLAVGAVGPNLQVWADSERQPYVAVTAPGVDITYLTAVNTTLNGVGTSFAAPFVAGTAALIRSRYPSMPWYTVVQRIINTGLAKGGPVPNDRYGYGILRIDRALNAAKYPVPASAPNPVYAGYQRWLASSQGKQFLAAEHPLPRPSRTHAVAAPAPSGSSTGLIAVIAVAVVVVAVGTALSIALRRRRRRYP
jgi:membrane-anchored mycosin MYCP